MRPTEFSNSTLCSAKALVLVYSFSGLCGTLDHVGPLHQPGIQAVSPDLALLDDDDDDDDDDDPSSPPELPSSQPVMHPVLSPVIHTSASVLDDAPRAVVSPEHYPLTAQQINKSKEASSLQSLFPMTSPLSHHSATPLQQQPAPQLGTATVAICQLGGLPSPKDQNSNGD